MTAEQYKIIISSGEKTFEISPSSGAHLIENGLSGFSSVGFDVSLCSYASQSGGYAQKRRFAEREMKISFEIERDYNKALTRRLVSLLDPRKDCEIDITLGEVRRKITAIPCDEPVFSRPTFSDSTEVTLFFTAPSVFFRSHNEIASRLREKRGLLTFPMNFTASAGLTSGVFFTHGSAEIENPGDSECGLIITITACDGRVEKPAVHLGDRYILCPLTLDIGDTLVIDTRPRLKNIYLNGERCFIFDKRSSFFSLPVGRSTVSVTCESGQENADTVIEFTPLYYGV